MGGSRYDQATGLYSPIKNVDLKTYPDLSKNFPFFINLKYSWLIFTEPKSLMFFLDVNKNDICVGITDEFHKWLEIILQWLFMDSLWVSIFRPIASCLKSFGPEVFQISEHCRFSAICTDFNSRTFPMWKPET